LKLHIRQGKDTVFLDKPAGLPTHAPDVGKQGFAEWAEDRLGQKLWVVHRLDKTTTGALVFATSAERAEELRRQFEEHRVQKVYWFLTDHPSDRSEFEIESKIEKQGSRFLSLRNEAPNSKTRFKRIKRSPFFELWEAQPLSGKPHQVRLHAADGGLPLLGDETYGGTPFPHLCLHSQSLQLLDEETWTSPAPRFFERLGVLKDKELVRILASLDRRQRLFHFLGTRQQCLRLVHTEISEFRLDKFGPVLWLNWYRSAAPTERDLERWDFVKTILKSPLLIQKRQDRGQDPNTQTVWTLGETPETWCAHESDLVFELRRDQGLSAGLFLDQRLNRERVRAISAGKKVLNLFAYTAGFSLAAAKGGASQVTTVDLSKSFVAWGRKNFELNGLNPSDFEWSAADSFIFLKGAIKRDRKWDLIVCDPPSFSRSERRVFKLNEDLEELLELCRSCLAPNGTLLFSCNLESVSSEQLERRIQKVFPRAKVERGSQDLDFELLNEERSLKSFWITDRRSK
jgi:23S rRNA (cytosine1962-C5)-methyltransferase